MFSTVRTTHSCWTAVVTCTEPCSARSWTTASWTRFVVIWSRRAGEPTVGVTSPEVVMVTPSAQRRGAGSRSPPPPGATGRGGPTKDRWSVRLRRSRASVRSIARVLTARRRSWSARVSSSGIAAGDVEQRLRDRQRCAQLVGRVGGEPPLFGDLRLEPREHDVEAVGELAELVLAPLQLDPVRERAARRPSGGVGDPRERGQHPPGEDPPAEEPEDEEEQQGPGRPRDERADEVVAAGTREERPRAGGVGELRRWARSAAGTPRPPRGGRTPRR